MKLHHWWWWSHDGDWRTTDFIRAVSAIVGLITVETLGDALISAFAGELVELALGARWIGGAVLFVGVVTTVVISITSPGFKNATLVGAAEFIGFTTVKIAASFIGSI